MAYGALNIRVRPLRVGFIVDPLDRYGLFRAIELNTFLWGGCYNPIIPSYLRIPAKWESHRVHRLPSPSSILEGYIDGFDPDVLVKIGKCENRTYQINNREVIREEELIGNLNDLRAPKYGIGIFELLNDFIEKELKYKRNDGLQVIFPELTRVYGLFLASVFGVLPKEAQKKINEYYINLSGISKSNVSINMFIELLHSPNFFPRRLTSWTLENQPLREPQLFICDAKSTLDIIDYWNLRAACFYVVPIPIQAIEVESIRNYAKQFIEKNYRPYKHNPEMFHVTTVQRSRTLTEDTVKKFCMSLNIPKDETKRKTSKFTYRFWYPRLWDNWARENAHSERVIFPYAYEEERRISEGEETLELRSLNPKFKLFRNYSRSPKFANEFNFRFYNSKEPMAEVFPEGSRELSSAIGRTGYFNWRFSKFGPVFLAHNLNDLIFINLPLAEVVMKEWFRERGWKVSLSGPGRIANQLLKQLGGTYGISWITHKDIIILLGELEKEAGMPRQAILGRLQHIIECDKLYFNSERFLEGLLSANALRLGIKIQCPVCTRHNWYELDELDYKLHCRFCLTDFSPPINSPNEIKWTYRAHGPFANSVAQGAYTVLLTLKLIKSDSDQGITPLFSYIAEKNGKQLEADLTCLYKSSMWHETGIKVIHAECKSFNHFAPRDIERMKDLSEAFPGAAIIFATLNSELNESELKLIKKMVVAERKKRLGGKLSNPIIILTGNELFADHISEMWENKGGIYEEINQRGFELRDIDNLADATQQIYLNLPSWLELVNAKWEKQRQKHVRVEGINQKTYEAGKEVNS